MQLKLFIVPVKNIAAAEAEMNGFLQQQLAGQQEQQQRVPVRPAPSSIPPGGTDQAIIPSCEGQREQAKTVSPPGVSSPAGR
jgi:hypothetical protein